MQQFYKVKAIYIYPITEDTFKRNRNPYIRDLMHCLKPYFKVVNDRGTRFGLLDMLLRFRKVDILYFNWIEDLPEKRYGLLQIPFLILILSLSKVLKKNVVWFIHNNISHTKERIIYKRFIISLMRFFSTTTITHTMPLNGLTVNKNVHAFDHPIEKFRSNSCSREFKFDFLIWGSIAPYKGVKEFLKFNYANSKLSKCRIKIVGKVSDHAYCEELKRLLRPNVFFSNRVIEDDELFDYFDTSKYILFTYNSSSISSSGALAKSLAAGKTIFGPNIGAFKILGERGLINTYNSFDELSDCLSCESFDQMIDPFAIKQYVDTVQWDNFGRFLNRVLRIYPGT